MRKSFVVVGLIAFLAPALAPVAALPQAKGGKGGVYEQLNLFDEAFKRIRDDAVEPVADKKLIESAISGMLAGLDPHSSYINEADYKAMQSKTPAESASIGLVVTLEGGQLKVVSPRDGSPAAAAGLKPGDTIFTIDKEPTYDLTLSEIEQKLRGPADSEVTLMLRRSGSSGPIEAKIKRTLGKFPTVTARLEAGDIGYVRLAAFDEATAGALAAAVKDLRQQAGNKLIGFILDLRNNPGGSFDAAVAAADAFIDKGDITVLKSRKAEAAKRIAATPGDLANGQPIVALVNGGTAREAELVAGALQDNKRAVLLGGKTFGESAIETVIPLNGNGAVRLTTARFQTPSGRAIHGKGLEPDMTVSPLKLAKMAQADRREADLRGALKNPDAAPNARGAMPAKGAPAPGKEPVKEPGATATPPGKGEQKPDQPTVASADMGTTADEQLSEAVDVLRGLALLSGRTAAR
jgi:carboxyl-terminal processing protease